MMRELSKDIVSEIRTHPFAVFTFIDKDEFPCSLPLKFEFNENNRRITMRKPRGVPAEVEEGAPSCVLFHSFNETGGNQRYVMFLGDARILSGDTIEFRISSGPFTRPPDYRESSNQDYFKERSEKYLKEIRPRMIKSEKP